MKQKWQGIKYRIVPKLLISILPSSFFCFSFSCFLFLSFLLVPFFLLVFSTALLFTLGAQADPQKAPTSPYDGKIVHSISVVISPIFEGNDLKWIHNTANDIKIETKERVVRREVLLKEGEPYSEFRARETARQLRDLRIFELAEVKPSPRPDGQVDVIVHVKDTWTLVPQGTFSQGGGARKQSIGLSESDLLGYGKRLEGQIEKTDQRNSVGFVWDDPRVADSRNRFRTAYFDRSDGERFLLFAGRPFRTFFDQTAWSIDIEKSDVLGRLFQNGTENYLFRQETEDARVKYQIAHQMSESFTRRFSMGFTASDVKFSQASLHDYDLADLDPREVSNDPRKLARDREFYGPTMGYESFDADFISMNYIDRFEIVQDYNLGDQFAFDIFVAPTALGSMDDSTQVSMSRTGGYRIDKTSFFRYEGGLSSRFRSGMENSLARTELKYYSLLGSCFIGEQFMGRHTLASSLSIDYGNRLDRDRQFIVGSENSIRGYDARAFSGDKRLTWSLEDRFIIKENIYKLVSLGGAFFFDAAGVSNDTVGDIVANRLYSDVGTGLRLGFPRSSGGGIIRFDVAIPLREGPDGSSKLEPRFVVSAGQIFDAYTRAEQLGPERANISVGFDNR